MRNGEAIGFFELKDLLSVYFDTVFFSQICSELVRVFALSTLY